MISVAQSSASDAMAVGYSLEPSTAPVALQWNGKTWVVTPTPHPAGGALLYADTAVPKTDEYMAAGEECTSKACPEAYVLSWDGTAWSQMTLPKMGNSTDISSISASSADDAWAVGQQCNNVRGICNPLILHWNGTTWSKVGVPQLKGLYADLYSVVDISKNDAWAVGSSFEGGLAINWNGHSWVKVHVPGATGGFNTGLDAIARVPGTSEIWALVSASGGQFTLLWDGTKWKGHNFNLKGFYSLSSIAASSTTSAWSVGNSFSKSGTEPSLTVRWNGHSWSTVKSPSPSPVDEMFSVTTSSSSSAIAVGVRLSPLQQNIASGLILDFKGSSWTKAALPTPTVPSGATPQASRMTESKKF